MQIILFAYLKLDKKIKRKKKKKKKKDFSR